MNKSLRIAILGAGFAGLSTAWHILEKTSHQVVIFDPKSVGGGASGIAAGLMHPYVGEQGRRSLHAQEGMQASLALIEKIEKELERPLILQRGIIRYVQNDEQRQMFLSHCQTYGDVTQRDENSFWINSGITVDCPLYLEGLWQKVAEKGAILLHEAVSDLTALNDFDHIIIAAGAGVKGFPELNALQMSLVKGQVLLCQAPEDLPLLPKSAISKGYIAFSSQQDPRACLVGSTYEREALSEDPDAKVAKELLFDKIAAFFPKVHQLEIISCKAALRVVRKGHYFPFVGKVKDNIWVITALGSRGLLYHAYLGQLLAQGVLTQLAPYLAQ